MTRMQYRIEPDTAATARVMDKTARKNASQAARIAQKGQWSNPGTAVALHPSFQQFLAEQTTLRGTQSIGARHVRPAAPQQGAAPEIIHTLRQGETIWELARKKYHVEPEAILRLNNITHPGTLRAGQQIRIPSANSGGFVDTAEEVVAGWYGEYHHGRLMANGERFDMHGATIAHRDMPMGTRVELENPQTGQRVEAVVTDRGPYHRGRDVDLSYGLAERLSLTRQGVGNLKMRVL
ncbi:RlpA-like double-psi beta-barrel domain-containing protein [Desulfobulbus propionicus]|nr:RlpA-like double-psi beta-barrel domain-containing protein [Desulfobulbus propionicus]